MESPTREELQLIEESLIHWWEFAEEEEAQEGRLAWGRIVSFIAECRYASSSHLALREVNDGDNE